MKLNMQLNAEEKKHLIIFCKIVTILILSVILSYTVFSPYFEVDEERTVIKITDTAEKNIRSGGTDVRIWSVKIGGKDISLDEFQSDGGWVYQDEVIMIVNPSEPASLSYETDRSDTLEIVFQKHDGSGIVRIENNGKLIKKLDLYSPEWDTVTVRCNLGDVSISQHPICFGFIMIISGVLVLFLGEFWKVVRDSDNRRDRKFAVVCIGMYAILGLGYEFFSGISVEMVYLILPAVGAVIVIGESGKVQKTEKSRTLVEVLKSILWLILMSYVMFLVVECVGTSLIDIDVIYIFGNMGIYLILLSVIYILSRRMTVTVGINMLAVYGYAVANFFVISFRGSPIIPGDFLVMETAKNVASNYQYDFTESMFFSLWLAGFFILLTCYSFSWKKETWKFAFAWLIPVVALTAMVCKLDFYAPYMDYWNLNNNVKKYGIAMSFLSNTRHMTIEEPEGYLEEEAEKYFLNGFEEAGVDEEFMPDVIVIMNESFSDLSVLSSQLDSNMYLSYFNSLEDNTVKGKALVSPLGGTTANTEYEFLTGNTMFFLRGGSVPFQQYVNRNGIYSITQILKTKGYHTIGIHPYDKKGYSRYRVYPRLGFDEFLDIDDFDNLELIRDRYASDRTSYEKVIEEYEKNQEQGQPIFIFNVTMQNHSGYDTRYFGEEAFAIPGYEREFPMAEEYLTLIKMSDESIHILLDYFSDVEKPVVIAFFGDHQPNVETEFYETMLGKSMEEWSLEESQLRYIVPFFIWTNYDIEEENGIFTSANYLSELMFEKAGINLNSYQEFLKETKGEIPALNGHCFVDSEGNWHSNQETTSVLEEYWKLQYCNMFDKKIKYE